MTVSGWWQCQCGDRVTIMVQCQYGDTLHSWWQCWCGGSLITVIALWWQYPVPVMWQYQFGDSAWQFLIGMSLAICHTCLHCKGGGGSRCHWEQLWGLVSCSLNVPMSPFPATTYTRAYLQKTTFHKKHTYIIFWQCNLFCNWWSYVRVVFVASWMK